MPSILEQLASSLGRRDEVPNQELAERIAHIGDRDAVRELVALLDHRDKNIQSDCIKVLYEIGERRPALLDGHAAAFAGRLDHKNNRIAWGAMTALDALAAADPAGVSQYLPGIIRAMDTGSVITRDHGVGILLKLCAQECYLGDVFPLLLEQVGKCPTNQLPMYAEQAMPVIPAACRTEWLRMLRSRLPEIEKESKRKRVEKVIARMEKTK